MKPKYIFALALLLVFIASPVLAAEFIKPDKTGNATISGEGHKNVYVAGSNVTVTSDIVGDLVAAGGNVIVQGAVGQDLMVAGGTLVINGWIGGDARIGGGNVTITGPVSGDVLIGGGNVTLAATAQISGDLIVGSGNIVVAAPIAGNVRIGGGTVQLNSKIGGEVFVAANESLTFGSQSMVLGKITYKGKNEAVVEQGAKISAINFQKRNQKNKVLPAPLALGGPIVWLLGIIVAGLLLLKFLPRRVAAIVDKSFDKPWTNLGVGLVFAIVLPVIGVLLCITIIGFYTGLILIAWLGLCALIVGILEPFVLGVVILKWVKKYDGLRWTALVTGAVVLTILSFVPFLGFLICVLIWLATFGAVLRIAKEGIASEHHTQLPI